MKNNNRILFNMLPVEITAVKKLSGTIRVQSIDMDISDVYTSKHQLIIEIKPKAVKIDKQQ